MRNVFGLALAALVSSLFAWKPALAVTEPSGCSMHFDVNTAEFVIGGGEGHGFVTCVGVNGASVVSVPVRIRVQSLGLQVGGFHLVGETGSIGIENPHDIFGVYDVVKIDAGVGIAAGGAIGFEGKDTGLNFNATLQIGVGVGAGVALSTWEILPEQRNQRW